MIPKIIHRIWLGGEIPENYKQYGLKWQELNPDWEVKLWTEDNLPTMKNRELFDYHVVYSNKSDVLRAEILYQFGGLYVDCDVEPLKPLDDFITNHTAFLLPVSPNFYTNAVLGAEPKNKFVGKLMDLMAKRYVGMMGIGEVVTVAVRENRAAITILDPLTFFPYAFEDKRKGIPPAEDKSVYSGSYAVHYWDFNRSSEPFQGVAW